MNRPNKTELLKKLKNNVALNDDERAHLISLLNTKKIYGLVWEDKPEAVEDDLRLHLPTLHLVPERTVIGMPTPPEATNKLNTLFDEKNATPSVSPPLEGQGEALEPTAHTLIEGDNLHALTVLTFTHANKVDVIYIDPPYNTGKENEFRYNDRYSSRWILKDDPFKHSTWLNFMIKRLKLAKILLSDTGVIIIHIDENEFDALNLLMESELFGEQNSLGQIIWNKQNPKGDAKGVAMMHEYILVYAKNKEIFTAIEGTLLRQKPNAQKILNKAKRLFSKIGKIEIPEDIKEVIKPFNFSADVLEEFKVEYNLQLVNKEFQAWINRQDFSGGEKAYKMIDENGLVYRGVSMAWPNKEQAPDDYLIPLLHPKTGLPCPMPARGWRNPSSRMKDLLTKKLILFGEDETKQPERKYLLHQNMFENTPSIYNSGVSDDDFFKDLDIQFAYPKPVEVAKYFLQSIQPNKSSLVLDFFAGSGTTLHAVMALNAEDGGNRQCILVTNNENNICEEVTYERNKRVIEGYTNSKGVAIAGLGNNVLRYYRTGFVARSQTVAARVALTAAATDLLCLKEGCYTEIQDTGCTTKEAQIFTNEQGKYLVIGYAMRRPYRIYETLCAYIAGIDDLSERVRLYVFSADTDTVAADFEAVADRIVPVPLPEALENAFKATYRTLKIDRERTAIVANEIQDTTSEAELF